MIMLLGFLWLTTPEDADQIRGSNCFQTNQSAWDFQMAEYG